MVERKKNNKTRVNLEGELNITKFWPKDDC